MKKYDNDKSAIIGRKTYVDFPSFNLNDVPAKVDTGADSSAIWASSIIEQDGVVSFVLFDKESPFYTGEILHAADYTIVSVKNSFGATEFRYKVIILMRIEGRNIRVRFALANRSNSSHPVLIGRRTIQGKFLVDVAVDPDKHRQRKILIVSAKKSKNVEELVRSTQSFMNGVIIDQVTYDDILFMIKDGMPSITALSLECDLSVYDIIHFKTSIQRDITAAFARYATRRGVRVLDPIIHSFPTTSKLYEYSIIADHEVLVPDTLFMTPPQLVRSYELFEKELGIPFVLKGIHSSRGEINDIVRDKDDFIRISLHAQANNQYLVGQRFVPNDGDYRVLTMGKQIKLVIHRVRKDNSTHLNNTTSGSNAREANKNELPPSIQIKCLEMAELMGRDIAGIDMVQHLETKEWYCFEVNDGPQIATGAFRVKKQRAFAEYLERELEK